MAADLDQARASHDIACLQHGSRIQRLAHQYLIDLGAQMETPMQDLAKYLAQEKTEKSTED
jgi:hypothetical protein